MPNLEALRERFYTELCENHGFRRPRQFRIPGYIDGVARRYVEIAAEAPLDKGLRVDIAIPVRAPSQDLFGHASCGGEFFLIAEKH